MTRARASTAILAIVVAAVGWLVVAPSHLGGGVSYVRTHGNSMEPGFQEGDLAVLTPTTGYEVGDVAAYHSEQLDTVVMHRIIDVEDDRYVLQGDNNSWLDPDRPTDDDMVGRLALRVPRGGDWLARLSSPPALGLVAFGLVASGGAAVRTRRRGRDRAVDSTLPHAPPPPRPRMGSRASLLGNIDANTVIAGALAGAVLAALVGAIGFGRPLRAPGPAEYTQHVTFAYTADVPAGPVYADGQVSTGDTVFLQVVDRLDVTADWHLEPPADHPDVTVEGTADLVLEVADGTGWNRTVPIAAGVPVRGDAVTMADELDLRHVRRLIEAAQSAAGTSATSQTLTLVARVDATGEVARQPMTTDFRSDVTLDLDALRLRPPSADPGSDPFQGTQASEVTVPDAEPAALTVAGRELPVGAVRGVALGLGALSLAGVVVGLLLRRSSAPAEITHIRSRYGHLLVRARGFQAAEGRTVVELESIEDLAAVADRLHLPMVEVPLRTSELMYTVDDLHTHYRFRPAEPIGSS